MGKNFMGYNNASELLTAIGAKIKAKYTKPSGGIPKSDLATAVQTSLGKADSAVQPATMTEALAAKQNSLSEAQLAAVNSGIDSTKVEQIGTNQTNILYSLQTGVKNICNPDTWILGYYLKPEDGSLIPYPGDNGITSDFIPVDYSSEDYYYISGLQNDGNNLYNVIHAFNASKQFLGRTDGTLDTTRNVYESSFTDGTPVGTGDIAYIRITQYGTSGKVTNIDTSLVMVCTGHAKEQSAAHQPFARPNYDLTVREAEDRAALAEQVDKGAKNLVDFSNLVSLVTQHATVTKTDTTITVSSTDTWGYQSYLLVLPAGKYELSFNATAVSISSGTMFIAIFSGQTATNHLLRIDVTATGAKHGSFEWIGGELNISFYANPSNTQIINSMTITDVMICTEAEYDISPKFVPYRPNWDLVSTLFPTSYTAPVVNSDISSKLSILSGGYAKVGNLVTVNIRLSVTDTISAGSALFIGLPEPKTTAALSYGSAVVPVTNMCVNAQVSPNVMSIDTQGTIRLAGTSVSSDMTIGIYILSATYLSA